MSKIKRINPSWGNDPEVMIMDTDSGKIVSSLSVIKNDKNDPIDLGDGVKMYADNVLLEFRANPAATIKAAVAQVGNAISKIQRALGSRYMLMPVASHVFDDLPPKPDDDLVLKWLSDLVPSDAVAKEWQVGCSPNWDAYASDQRKQSPFRDGLRSGSFHMHIGRTDYQTASDPILRSYPSKIMAVKLMDIYVGCAMVLCDKDTTSLARRALYGRAGEFRSTPYGIEYRVLGNYVMRHPSLVELVYELAEHALSHLEDGTAETLMESVDFNTVQAAINENDARLARIAIDDSWIPVRLYDKLSKLKDQNFTPDSMLLNWKV